MEKIAIIGLSCLFPDAKSPAEFWQNLINQTDSISLSTAEQMGVDPTIFYDPVKGKTGKTGKYYCMKGGYIKNFRLDTEGYHIDPEILQSLDSIYQWSLYIAKQALQDSGYLENASVLAKCGVILGNLSSPTRFSYRLIAPIYQRIIASAVQELFNQPQFKLKNLPCPDQMSILNGLTAGYPSAIVAQALGLSGINFSLDAACASSLYAVKLACHYLSSGKADLMLAGAVSCTDPFMTHTAFSLFQAYSDDGISRPLDQGSGGLMTGEGAGMLALKRYSDAVRDGDRIYATILGLGLSNDGRGKHFLSPNPRGQVLAFERAYAAADIDPQSIQYVECHGTGTPLGDRTELNSMDTFFGQYGGKPKIGSVKSNIGHLLTAAGMPSMLKVILSMNEGVIPPTLNLQEPLSSVNNVIEPEQIVKSVTPWDSQPSLKRAAVSAFGFGGTNSHLILEHGTSGLLPPASPVELPKLAIVGMDAFFGQCHNLDAFDRCIYDGSQQFIPLPNDRWRGFEKLQSLMTDADLPNAEPPLGAYIKEFELDYLHFRIPPDANDQPIPQQLLILKVADDALRDAGLEEGANVAVIVAMSTELASHQHRARCDWLWQGEEALAKVGIVLPPEKKEELEEILKEGFQKGPMQVNQCISFIGNIMASRISTVWDFTGPTFTVSAEENSVFKALEVAQMLLSDNTVDAVLVGAVDLTGGVENVLLRSQIAPLNTGTATLGCDRASNGWMVGEGAGAVVVKRLDTTQQDDRVYAVIDAISLVQDNPTSSSDLPLSPQSKTVTQSCQQAFHHAGITPDKVSYVEMFGSGIAEEDAAEVAGLTHAYGSAAELSCAIGSVKANIGHTFSASGMASLIKTALCLYHRYIPATPRWSRPKQPELWQGSPFYVATDSRPWSVPDRSLKRIAAINGLGLDRTYAHVILSEDLSQPTRSNRVLEQLPFRLFPLAGNDRDSILHQLDILEQTLDQSPSLITASGKAFETFRAQSNSTYTAAIVGQSKEDIRRELDRARSGIAKAFEQNGEWKTPLGSYFTANPLGKEGSVAFVYPGAFTSYIGMGRESSRLFPNLFDKLALFGTTKTQQQQSHQSNQALYPRSLEALSVRQLETLELQMIGDANNMLTAGTLSTMIATAMLKDHFQVQPKIAFGYSLGEVSMMFSLNVWTSSESLAHGADDSPLFQTRLSGPKNAVREHWGLPPSQETASDDFWSTYVVMTDVDRVLEALKQIDRVYLTHINTPTEVVVAGDARNCQQMIDRLQCESFRAPANYVLHCEPMRSEYNEFAKWMVLPTQAISDTQLYTAATYENSILDSQRIAHNIADALTKPLNFPRLVDRVYADGARIFIEVGPGGTCSRWIRETLKQKPHITMPVVTRGVEDAVSIVRLLAKLVSHQVPVDLSSLYPPVVDRKSRSLIKTVTLGGQDIRAAILTEENRRIFAEYRSLAGNSKRPLVGNSKRSSDLLPSSPLENEPLFPYRKPRDRPIPKLPPIVTQPQTIPALERLYSLSPTSPRPMSKLYQTLRENLTLTTQTQRTFLQTRQESLQQISNLIQLQMSASQQMLGKPEVRTEDKRQEVKSKSEPSIPRNHPPKEPLQNSTLKPQNFPPNFQSSKPRPLIFDEAEVLEFAEGKLSNVFGSEYVIVDTYPRRVRLPMPPYLFISRVTKMQAKRGCFEPCFIETEFDLPDTAGYPVPCAMFIEACQGNMILISYLGIDFEIKGERVYRALDGIASFVGDLPQPGETIRCCVQITSFVRSGDTLLYFFEFEIFVGDRKFLEARGGAGFFTDEELKKGQGVTLSDREKAARNQIQKQSFKPLLDCPKTHFDKADLIRLSEGDFSCFGANYHPRDRNPALRFPLPLTQMVDRIVAIDPTGGAWGLGLIVAEKDLNPEHWYFNCHFKDDYCLPGTLIGEGCSQVSVFYALYLGLQTRTQNAKFDPIMHLTQSGRSRGQVTPTNGTLTYQLEITEIGLDPTPYLKADASVIFEGKTISFIKNLGTRLVEQNIS
ncbi:PfaB family protein [Phormidesmis priestleyi]